MPDSRTNQIRFHEDRQLFRESVSFTAAATEFPARLIEKDYYCTLLLDYFAATDRIVFKGGTCLAKVHANFYRLSEDLDFVIPMPVSTARKERSRVIQPTREDFVQIEKDLPIFRITKPFEGANESKQYIGVLGYDSLFSAKAEVIKFEVSLREPLLEPAEPRNAQTILLHPVSNEQCIPPVHCTCISRMEAYAEKFRAALTRVDPEIRDYFDIDYAIRHLDLNPEDRRFLNLVKEKIAVPGNKLIDIADGKFNALLRQRDIDLRPFLRRRDYDEFELERIFRVIKKTSELISHDH